MVQTHIVRSIEINGAIVNLQNVSDHYPVFVDIRLPGSTSIENVEGEPDFNVYFDGVRERFCIQGEMPLEQIDVYATDRTEDGGHERRKCNSSGCIRIIKRRVYRKRIFCR